eukprot:SAG31_NODE_6374_length_2040_cov_1.838228_1_plen_424_part_10
MIDQYVDRIQIVSSIISYMISLQNKSNSRSLLSKIFDRTKSHADQLHDEMVAAQEAFEIIDTDGSGTLDRLEMFNLTQHLGMNVTASELDGIIGDMCDGSYNGPHTEVSFDQFYTWWGNERSQGSNGGHLKGIFSLKKIKKTMGNLTKTVAETAEARLMFDSFDADGSGTLDDSEVVQLAAALGKELSAAELADAMAEMRGSEGVDEMEDTEASVEISFEEFWIYWQKHRRAKSGFFGGLFQGAGALIKNRKQRNQQQKEARKTAQLSEKQEQELQARKAAQLTFQLIDTDGSGSLDKKEILELAESLEWSNMTREEVQVALDEMDADGDGEVTFEEFWNFWQQRKHDHKGVLGKISGYFGKKKAEKQAKQKVKKAALAAEREEQILSDRQAAQAAFDILDEDGSGTLDRGEVKVLAQSLGTLI